MGDIHVPWYVGVFLALGGAALVWKIGKKAVVFGADKAGDWLFSPARSWHSWLVANWAKIKEAREEAEAELDKDAEEAAKEDSNGPSSPA